MNRIELIKSLCKVLLCASFFSFPVSLEAYENPVSGLSKNVRILKDDGTYYRYYNRKDSANLFIDEYTTTDVTTWPTAKSVTLTVPRNTTDKQDIWPADVRKSGGIYWMHYTLVGGTVNAKNIWAADSSSPDGTFTGKVKLVDRDVGVLDPTTAVDGTRRFLIYKIVGPWGGMDANDGAIYGRELKGEYNLKEWKTGSGQQKLIGYEGITWTAGKDHVEAPDMLKRGDWRFCQYTSGHPTDETYAIGYGRKLGNAVLGSYTNETKTNPLLKTRQDPVSGKWTYGPGAGECLVVNGHWWILYSAKSQPTSDENMHLERLTFNNNKMETIHATNGSTQTDP